jgi:hypothetical protein
VIVEYANVQFTKAHACPPAAWDFALDKNEKARRGPVNKGMRA